jgi:hypothetical protein
MPVMGGGCGSDLEVGELTHLLFTYVTVYRLLGISIFPVSDLWLILKLVKTC